MAEELKRLTIVIQTMEHMQKRPGMYVDEADPAVLTFLEGFHAAVSLFGIHSEFDAFHNKAVIDRGWTPTAGQPSSEMKERGLNKQAIISETLNIEIDAWKALYESLVKTSKEDGGKN